MRKKAQTRRRHGGGFTLLELTLSLGILVILLGAVASMMALAGRAIPKETDSDQKISTLRQKLGDMCDDLSLATSITAVTATGITFVVPDRDNDGTGETLSYAWSGTAGTPLNRTDVNTSNAPLILGVDSLVITLSTQARQRDLVSGTVDSAEQLLCAYTGPSSGDATVDTNTRIALCIHPNISSDVSAWQLTRLRYEIKSLSGFSYAHTLKMHDPNAQGWVDESALLATYNVAGVVAASDTMEWMNVPTAGLAWKLPSDSVWAVLGPPASGTAKYSVPYAMAGHMCYTDGRARILTIDLWNKTHREYVLRFEAFGKVRTPATTTQNFSAATKVQIAVRLSTGEEAAMSARLWNLPEVP